MYTIYKRLISASVPSWAWFFRQLQVLGRRLGMIDEMGLKEASLDRDHFAPGFWLEVDGSRWSHVDDEEVLGSTGTYLVHRREYGSGRHHRNVGEYAAVGIRNFRVSLGSDGTGPFLIAYTVRLNVRTDGLRYRNGVYSTVHVDGNRVNEATDYIDVQNKFGFGLTSGNNPFSGSHVQTRLSGYAYVRLIQGIHTVEVMIHGHDSFDVLTAELSIAEIH